MKNIFTLLFAGTLCHIAISGFSQNVGIGTLTPTDGKLHVTGAENSTIGMFATPTTGIGLLVEGGRPAMGFNMNFNTGYKFRGTGYGGLFWYQPASGLMSYYSSNASGVAGGAVGFSSSLLTIQQDGNVGISASPTEAKLQVHEPAGNTQFIAAAGNNLPGVSAFVPVSSPSIGFNARYQSGYKFMGPGHGSFFQYSPSLGRLQYWYSNASGVADGTLGSSLAFVIDSSGRLGVGTSSPTAPLHVTGNVVFGSSSINPATGYKVSIDGKVICEELKVQLNAAWPDYVFEPTYSMLPLQDLRKQVMQQKHLPGIPSAAEVTSSKGVEVGAMQQKLLEKIEELYRYVFKMDEENSLLKKEVAELKAAVNNK